MANVCICNNCSNQPQIEEKYLVMTAKPTSTNAPNLIRQFTAAKQTKFFASLKQRRFSGQIILTSTKGMKWAIYLYLGRIIYATGGVHPVRRWRRNLTDYCPQILPDLASLQADINRISTQTMRTCWEYQLLSLWIDERKISREQVSSIVRSTIVEVMFDITQTVDVSYQIKPDGLLSTRLAIFDADQIIAEAYKLWQLWQQAKVADRSPNMAPVIRQPQQLQQRTSPKIYQNLTQLLNGKQSLRDLAVRMKRDLVTVTKSLLPYIQLGLVELVEIPDFPSPVNQNQFSSSNQITSPGSTKSALIACVDDSPLTCQTMQKILTDAGYQFLGINDPLRAIATLLSRKPDLIFLDLVMPNTNGYEICSQLRKLSFFRQTPIIILTGNDGIIDRVRAKMVGSTDFISKPVENKVVLATINKYLKAKSQI